MLCDVIVGTENEQIGAVREFAWRRANSLRLIRSGGRFATDMQKGQGFQLAALSRTLGHGMRRPWPDAAADAALLAARRFFAELWMPAPGQDGIYFILYRHVDTIILLLSLLRICPFVKTWVFG